VRGLKPNQLPKHSLQYRDRRIKMKMRRVVLAIALVTLSSCAGGGGSSGPPPPPQPTVTLDSSSIDYPALYVENYPITVTPHPTAFTFANFVSSPNVRLSAPTTGGVNSLSFTMADASHGVLHLR
jgi:hypothetical protein